MNKEKGLLIVMSGPSGAGKSTVAFKAMEGRGDMCFSVSATTRDPRPGEADGREYFFVTRDKFETMIENDEFLEHAEYVSNCYGTPRAYVENKLNEGMNVLLDIEVQGARQVHEKMPEAVMIFCIPPTLSELEKRLVKRGTDSPEKIKARLERAREEYKAATFYDYIIVNDDPGKAANELLSIITAEKCKFNIRKNYLEEV